MEHRVLLKRFKKFWPECNEFRLDMETSVEYSHVTGLPLEEHRGGVTLGLKQRDGFVRRLMLNCLTGELPKFNKGVLVTNIKDITIGCTIYIHGVGYFFLECEEHQF